MLQNIGMLDINLSSNSVLEIRPCSEGVGSWFGTRRDREGLSFGPCWA